MNPTKNRRWTRVLRKGRQLSASVPIESVPIFIGSIPILYSRWWSSHDFALLKYPDTIFSMVKQPWLCFVEVSRYYILDGEAAMTLLCWSIPILYSRWWSSYDFALEFTIVFYSSFPNTNIENNQHMLGILFHML